MVGDVFCSVFELLFYGDYFFFFSSRRRHTRYWRDWSSDVCSSDLAARVSPQYLSEVERGRKEASSEILAAVTAALGLTLLDLAHGVAVELGAARTVTLSSAPSGGAAGGPAASRNLRSTRRDGHDVVLLAA